MSFPGEDEIRNNARRTIYPRGLSMTTSEVRDSARTTLKSWNTAGNLVPRLKDMTRRIFYGPRVLMSLPESTIYEMSAPRGPYRIVVRVLSQMDTSCVNRKAAWD